MLRIFLHRKVRTTTTPAGTERRIVFRLTPRGARLLRRAGTMRAILRGSIRSGAAPVVREVRLRIGRAGDPRTGRPSS